MPRIVALIRGINVGSARKLPMAELRAACEDAGLGVIRTYIQSGNLVLDHVDPPLAETALEALIASRFGLDVPVAARTTTAWQRLIATCPLPVEAEAEPRQLHLLVCKRSPGADAVQRLAERARDGEKVARWGDEIAIHFTNGVGASRMLPAVIDRALGTPATARNWNTVLMLGDMSSG